MTDEQAVTSLDELITPAFLANRDLSAQKEHHCHSPRGE